MSSTISRSISLSRHTLRQLKFVIPGGAITYYLGTHEVFWRMVNGIGWDGWGRCVTMIPPFVYYGVLIFATPASGWKYSEPRQLLRWHLD
jgi:hypothetical protein